MFAWHSELLTMVVKHQLLFGLLALQNGLIDKTQLAEAFRCWLRDRKSQLADHVVQIAGLSEDDRSALNALVKRQVDRHHGDVDKSLSVLPLSGTTREILIEISPPELESTLDQVGNEWGDSGREAEDAFQSRRQEAHEDREKSRYRVIRKHAKGGIGEVLVAVDDELNREVALKQVLEDKADDLTHRQRLVVEAEITGGLEHPGIVPVYGLGTYGNGRPFYAMRFIKGENLKEAISKFHSDPELKLDPGRRAVELNALLRRFTDVCNAIDYAHMRGVLHRDIKPGNIIVGKYGETLVVDWGLAKAKPRDPEKVVSEEQSLHPRSASGSAATIEGSALGTPAYMSPEQASGKLDELGPRSDVYSLGATLYCILAGRAPFRGRVLEVIELVKVGQFDPPRKFAPSVDPALEAICLKAMSLAPGDRYESSKLLSDDIAKWIADEPVTAWREPLVRRVRRWLRHHRTLTYVGLASILFLTASLGFGIWMIDRERRKTERQFLSIQGLATKLIDFAESQLSLNPGQEGNRRRIYETVSQEYEQILEQRPNDVEVLYATAMAHFYLGNMQRFYLQNDAATKAFERANELLRRATQIRPTDLRILDRIAELSRDRGRVAYFEGRLGDAKKLLEDALKIVKQLREADPESIEFRRTEANVLLATAEIYSDLLMRDEAEKVATEAAQFYKALQLTNADLDKIQPALATRMNTRTLPLLYAQSLAILASILYDNRKFDQALEVDNQAVDIAAKLAKARPIMDNKYQHATALVLRAETKIALNAVTEAILADLDLADSILNPLIAENARLANNRLLAILIHKNRAILHRKTLNWEQSRVEFNAAETAMRSLVEDAKSPVGFLSEEAKILHEHAETERGAGTVQVARTLERTALERINQAIAKSPENLRCKEELATIEAALKK
jgi:serine/threonine-protein kinase